MGEELPEHGVTLQKEGISDFLSWYSLDSFVEVTDESKLADCYSYRSPEIREWLLERETKNDCENMSLWAYLYWRWQSWWS